jgi:phage terminase small subunit
MGFENSGRRPRPTAVKLLRGTMKRDINKREPLPPVDGPVVKPAGLSAGGSVVWDQIAPIVLAMRTLTAGDVPTFVTFCELQATFNGVIVEKSKPGYAPVVWSEDATGEPVAKIHPVVKLERDTANALGRYYSYFGLEPSGRSRIVLPEAVAPVSKWA